MNDLYRLLKLLDTKIKARKFEVWEQYTKNELHNYFDFTHYVSDDWEIKRLYQHADRVAYRLCIKTTQNVDK